MAVEALQQRPHEILAVHLAQARARSDELFRLVRPSAMHERPIPERHRIIFYLGHLEAFDWNLIGRDLHQLDSFHAEFDRLFAFGIDPTNGSLPDDQPADWPRETEVQQYNRRVRDAVDRLLLKISDDVSVQRFWVAVEHRLMHAETLSYMLHWLSFDQKMPQPSPVVDARPSPPPRRIEIPAGQVTLGLDNPFAFGWDNEFRAHSVRVPAFAIDAFSVTNGQFLQFVQAGGYETRELWTDEGWRWITSAGIRHPKFWKQNGREWVYRTMFAETALPLGWPVYVSHAEAQAYAGWAGKALPTEVQFHRAAYGSPDQIERSYPWGDLPPDRSRGNFDFASWTPTRVGAFPQGASAFGVSDLVGNGYEWTSTVFEPFPGFEAFSFYPGYSANFFDGGHYVLKGGSPRTGALLLRRSLRNWFQPLYPYIYAKFRCVEN